MDDYTKKYCWYCNRTTLHEDGVCLECKGKEWTQEEIKEEEDRRRNENAAYVGWWNKWD